MQDNFIVLNFEDSKLPEFKEVKGKPWVQFGEDDLYPNYLLLLSNKSAKHNAIINGKVNYIFGNGFKANGVNDLLINKCNGAGEGIDDIAVKMIKDCEVFGGYYLQIIPDALGRIAEIYHIDFNSIRVNMAQDQFYYKKDWRNRREEVKVMPKYVKGNNVSGVFFFKEYRQGDFTYPLPNYIPAINYIESDFEVSKQTLSNAKTGFSASKMISFFNGEPSEDDKKKIERRFNVKFGGSDGKKTIITFNNDPTKAPTVEDLGSSDLSKEDFTAVDNLITSNIFAGHQITSPMLFGIMESGKLGSGNELKYAYDIFKNTYVNFKQKQIENVLGYLFGMEFKLQDVEPISLQLDAATITAIAPKAWLYDKLGIDTEKYPITSTPSDPKAVNATTAPAAQQEMVNDNIKNLSAKQHQQLMRIIRQFSKGQLTKQAATALLKTGLGLNDTDVASLLGIEDDAQFEKEYTEEEVADMLIEVGTFRNNYEIIKTKKARFIEDEFEPQEIIAASFDLWNVAKKIALPSIKIMYSYDKAPEATGPAVLPNGRTRLFCKKLVESGKVFTRQQIQSISTAVGYSVWDRRGGFWTMPNGEHSPSCRHIWNAHIVINK